MHEGMNGGVSEEINGGMNEVMHEWMHGGIKLLMQLNITVKIKFFESSSPHL